jgi:hypothetical protein
MKIIYLIALISLTIQLRGQVGFYLDASTGVNIPNVIHINGGPAAINIYQPGISHRFGGGLLMQLPKKFFLDVRYGYQTFGLIDGDRVFIRQIANTTGLGLVHEHGNMKAEIAFDYCLIHKVMFDNTKVGRFNPEYNYLFPNFLLGSLYFKYKYLKFEPYFRMSKGITQYHNFQLFFFDGVRAVFAREIAIGTTYQLFGRQEKNQKAKKSKHKK